MRSFEARGVVITGAAGGLGHALVAAFLQAGARVLALDCNAAALAAMQEAMSAQGTDHAAALMTLVCDITRPQDCDAAIAQAVALWGGVDVLVNNAGISHRSLFADTDPAVLRKVMDVNFFGAVHMTHAALPQLLARRGVVAALSSVAGYAPLLGRTGYCASKHALHGFFDTLRTEVQERGVQVTLICPSFIATGIGAAGLGGSGSGGHAPHHHRRRSAPNDIAQRILAALAQGKEQLLPDRTSRLAWWVSRLAPRWYVRTMKRRVRTEFEQ
ncbi:MAG: SDR family oxidoreductase [Simplicispira sp.]|nr:SDR family oxidoreductase [Simplicispira sp.]